MRCRSAKHPARKRQVRPFGAASKKPPSPALVQSYQADRAEAIAAMQLLQERPLCAQAEIDVFGHRLLRLSSLGNRVLAVAYRKLEAQLLKLEGDQARRRAGPRSKPAHGS